ncbi:DUF4345 family protein [Hyphobacterium sp.]|uniref:DUF4345 family protein n=1 Tax=Hyphobacterium sp. TaxID=2004662 RepID=UPI003BA8F9DD
MSWFVIIAFAAAVIGFCLGVGGLISPKWRMGLTRLMPAKPEGAAEFRATFGGFFLGAHAAAMLGILFDRGVVGASFVLAAAWGASASGRLVALALEDGTRHKSNYIMLVIELALAVALILPAAEFFLT